MKIKDRTTGDVVIAKRNGMTLMVRIGGTIPPGIAAVIDRLLREHEGVRRLEIDCHSITDLDAVGLRILATALERWTTERGGIVELVGLDERLQRRLGWHPLALYIADRQPRVWRGSDSYSDVTWR